MNFEQVIVSSFGPTPVPAAPAPAPAPPPPTPQVEPAPLLRPQQPDAWQAAASERETLVPLGRLPEGVVFADGFAEPIRYDTTRRALIYRGLMLSASYADLRRVSHDPAYLTALDELYIATALPAGGTARWPLWLALALLGAAALAGGWWLANS